MNFLAHFALAQPTDASRVGALLGDFVRGHPSSLTGQYPPEVIEGIMLHRAIDRFTDDHPVFLKAKDLLSPKRRRFAGIIIDIFFDHFLAIHWEDFEKGNLPRFISELYDTLERRHDWLTPELHEIVPRMKDENWLQCYGTIEGLKLTFERISKRRSWLKPLVGAETDLIDHYQSFDRAFHTFYPEVRQYATTWERD
ncbi:MAG: ACP phosphodiesterase [Verrucomicrobiaceae bacterium]